MKKGTIIFKKKIASFLVVLMCINTMGAVVSDNDGSAFITKAEFDSLKNNFQAQIDQYNTSIDSKIDGAIAAYLAGVKVQKQEEIILFIDKIKERTIFWTSDPNFAYHPNRPKISEIFKWGCAFLTTAYSMTYTNTLPDYYIESGTVKNSFFVVDECAKWGVTLNGECNYFFGGQDNEAYIGGRWPSSSMWTALKKISIANPGAYGFQCWTASGNREYNLSPTNTGGWRSSSAFCGFSTNKVSTTSIVLAPFSTKKTYVYDTGNELNQNEKITGSADIAYKNMYFDDEGWGEVIDTRTYKTLQTVDPKSLSLHVEANRWPDINHSSAKIPWLTKTYDVKELKFKSLIDISNFDKPIKNGICLFTAEKNGIYNLSFTATDAGYGMFSVGKTAITNWGKPSAQVSNVKYIAYDGVHQSHIDIDTQKGENLFFIFYPNDQNAISQVTFVESYFNAD